MGRYRIRLKLQGLEVEVDGTRDDPPGIAYNLSRQFAGLLEPAAQIAEGEVEENGDRSIANVATAEPIIRTRPSRRAARRAAPVRGGSEAKIEVAWKHDPSKWGSPQQGWSAADKAIWLLYVSGQETQVKDMSSSTLASAFNKMFREAGMIRAGNLPRDLGRLKAQVPALVGEDTTKTPSTWFLTNEGTKRAEELVKQARGQAAASS